MSPESCSVSERRLPAGGVPLLRSKVEPPGYPASLRSCSRFRRAISQLALVGRDPSPHPTRVRRRASARSMLRVRCGDGRTGRSLSHSSTISKHFGQASGSAVSNGSGKIMRQRFPHAETSLSWSRNATSWRSVSPSTPPRAKRGAPPRGRTGSRELRTHRGRLESSRGGRASRRSGVRLRLSEAPSCRQFLAPRTDKNSRARLSAELSPGLSTGADQGCRCLSLSFSTEREVDGGIGSIAIKLLAQVREIYGRVAYTHKTHEKQVLN